jgi:hypothetical protein
MAIFSSTDLQNLVQVIFVDRLGPILLPRNCPNHAWLLQVLDSLAGSPAASKINLRPHLSSFACLFRFLL